MMEEKRKFLQFMNEMCPDAFEKEFNEVREKALKGKEKESITITRADFIEKSAEAMSCIVLDILNDNRHNNKPELGATITLLSPIIISAIEKMLFENSEKGDKEND